MSEFSKSSEAERQLFPPDRTGWGIWPWIGLLGLLAALLVWRGTMKPADVGEQEMRGEHHPAVGTKLTRFSLEPLTGESREVSIGDLEGKVTLVNFWGPWCGACLIEFPHLMEIEQHFRSQSGFQFFSVSSNYNPADETDLAKNTEQFLNKQRAEFPTYRDPRGQTTMALAVAAREEQFGYPATALLGPEGEIRGLWIGYQPGDEKAVRQAIEKTLANKQKSS